MKTTLLKITIAATAFCFGILAESSIRFAQNLWQKAEVAAPAEFEAQQPPPVYSEPDAADAVRAVEEEDHAVTPSGYYFSEKEVSADFDKNVTLIYLSVHFEDGKRIAVGSIYDTSKDKGYEQAAVDLSEKTFNLRTKKVGGVEYKFEGVFLKNGFRNEFKYGEKVLKGKLQKFVNGKKVKEIKSKFIYEYEACGGDGGTD